jgi:xanthine phosphoribosyltransferase
MPTVDLQHEVANRARLEGPLIMVDEFINHRVDPSIMRTIGEEIAKLLTPRSPDVLLTAEASGIAPAVMAAQAMHLPMVYAKKFLGTGNRYSHAREVSSPTKGVEYRVEVSRRMLAPGQRVGIVDDFLAGGRTAESLGEIVEEAGGEVAAFCFVIEKGFMHGRDRLERHGWPVESLVRVLSINTGQITFAP